LDPKLFSAVLLPSAVGVIMFGLGLSLTLADFVRVARYPKAVCIGLFVQTVVLVAVALLITQLFALPPILAVGLMLLAASPGGAMANIFSHLARGDVALNITLTAINSALSLVWLPLVMSWSLSHFLGAEHYVPLPTRKVLEVAVIIIAPVILGMLVRRLAPSFADRAETPVRLASVLVLAGVVALSLVGSGETLARHVAAVGLACITFNLVSLAVGYSTARLAGLPVSQATSISFEIGVHNAAVAIYVAMQLQDGEVASAPAALYGLIQIGTATLLVTWLRYRRATAAADVASG
jgi:BASS family bile acid:Na+ symporter